MKELNDTLLEALKVGVSLLGLLGITLLWILLLWAICLSIKELTSKDE